jgi:hypothetical protein
MLLHTRCHSFAVTRKHRIDDGAMLLCTVASRFVIDCPLAQRWSHAHAH